MPPDATPANRMPLVRRATGVAGALLVVLALMPEIRHTGSPGLGAIQVALLALGVLALLIAWLGRRLPSAYRATAVIVLNTVVFLGALELGAALVGGRMRQRSTLHPEGYYGRTPWGARFLREQSTSMAKDVYRPFALWKRAPTSGQSVNVDAEGVRLTPGATCVPGAYRVLMLGGSTMWGIGSPDSATIPARFQAKLAARTTRPVCVVNLGEKGYTSLQELVFLVTRLRSDAVPDLMVFYDGVNDVRVAADQSDAGLHFGLRQVADKLEEVPPPLALRVRRSSFMSLVLPPLVPSADSLVVEDYRARGVSADSLADRVVARYLDTHRAIRGLSREYGFDYAFFWQPVIWRTKKPFTAEEQVVVRNAVQGLPELYHAVYSRIHEIAPREDGLYDISDVFDGQTAFIYNDFNHVVPEGNEMVVTRMLADLDRGAGARWIGMRARTPRTDSSSASSSRIAPTNSR